LLPCFPKNYCKNQFDKNIQAIMINRWKEKDAEQLNNDLLKLRVYTSRLLGAEEDLVLHGGGNTSVKIEESNPFGEQETILYVKGSGWNLGTIESAGFAPVKLETLLKLAEFERLSDTDMVRYQRMAMTNPDAPNPSVEAILHAIIPFAFVDHTHADAVVTITNTPEGRERIEKLYGSKVLIVPYVMPGFILARKIYEMTRNIDWSSIDAMILMNHGVFTFHDDPKVAYSNMIDIVSKAEHYLMQRNALDIKGNREGEMDPLKIARLRKAVSEVKGRPVLAHSDNSADCTFYASLPELNKIANRGPLTPDHIIRTKRTPLIIVGKDHSESLSAYVQDYQAYFDSFNPGDLTCLDKAPRWSVWPRKGCLYFGTSMKEVRIIKDICRHTMKAIYQAEKLRKWEALGQKELFEMEYWELEQLKLKKGGKAKVLQGKIALVTGAASGIGKATVISLLDQGAAVIALDINPDLHSCFNSENVLALQCDVCNSTDLKNATDKGVAHFGGLDMLLCNAGIFPSSMLIGEMKDEIWNKSLQVNLTAHQQLLKYCLPYLEAGIDPAVVIVGSKNVPAPGAGAAAYSVAKAGLTQLGRIAAMEMGKKGIRVNILHPNAVYDTGIWTEEVLKSRSAHYGLSVEDYKTNNILKVEINSEDVANIIVLMLGISFSKITGAQLPVDGGNLRII
jgi:rhamnose utilization protein RhaD (predicted bifunctional aldolase and dehydrogenase)/NAD(P)-dependent dehydrogenase (short-subunit alcohol dehydrogenase family)